MALTIFLDTGPLGILTNPKYPPLTLSALTWAREMMIAGHRFVVPAIADFEVRRELERAGKMEGLEELDVWNSARPDRFLPLTSSALRLGAKLWAQARNAGMPTADMKELDCDVLIAAQALDMGLETTDFVIATVNVRHLALFAPAEVWQNIKP